MQQRTVEIVRILILAVAVLWAIELVNQITGHQLNQVFGLEPRAITGLIGVPAMPFLHGGIGHLAANTPPLLILGALGLWIAPGRFLMASLVIIVLSGIAVWLVARPNTIHVGASGLIFGWLGFLLALGLVERSWQAIAGAAIVFVLYGSMILGVLPGQEPSVSWEAHFFGMAAGALTAWIFREPRRRR